MTRWFVPFFLLGLCARPATATEVADSLSTPSDSIPVFVPVDSLLRETQSHVPAREPDLVVSSAGSRTNVNPFHIRLHLLRLGLKSVYDSNIDHDLADVDSYGFMGRLEGTLRTHSKPPYVWLGYLGGYQTFSSSTMWDRWEHQVELGTRISFARAWSLVASGEYDNRASTEDREIVNQFTVSPQLRYDETRFGARAYGSYRKRRNSETPAYGENIWMAGGELRTNPWRRGVLRLGYRHEDATSYTPKRSYTRDRVQLIQETRVGRRHAFLLRGEHQWRKYPLDSVDVGDTEVSRQDRSWIASASWTWALPSRQDIVLDYEFQKRTSNDPEEAYTAHRVELGVRWSLLK